MIIKAQQQNMRRAPYPLKPVLFDIDVGPVRYKRVLEELIHREQYTGTRDGEVPRGAQRDEPSLEVAEREQAASVLAK